MACTRAASRRAAASNSPFGTPSPQGVDANQYARHRRERPADALTDGRGRRQGVAHPTRCDGKVPAAGGGDADVRQRRREQGRSCAWWPTSRRSRRRGPVRTPSSRRPHPPRPRHPRPPGPQRRLRLRRRPRPPRRPRSRRRPRRPRLHNDDHDGAHRQPGQDRRRRPRCRRPTATTTTTTSAPTTTTTTTTVAEWIRIGRNGRGHAAHGEPGRARGPAGLRHRPGADWDHLSAQTAPGGWPPRSFSAATTVATETPHPAIPPCFRLVTSNNLPPKARTFRTIGTKMPPRLVIDVGPTCHTVGSSARRRWEPSPSCWSSPSPDKVHSAPAWENRGSITPRGRLSKRRPPPPTVTCPGCSLTAPIEELTQTENAQLATTALSLVVLDAVERIGLTPAACAGHSLGEYTALVASGALGFEDGIRLVVARGDAMARAGEEAPGTMAALLGIADDDAEAACMRAEGDVWVANYNAPGQVVIAGTPEAVARAGELAKGLGAKRVMPIQVSGAFHTPVDAGRPGRPAQGAGRSDLPHARGPRRRQRRRARARRPGRLARAAVGPALLARALAPDARDVRRTGAHLAARARTRAASSAGWPSAACPRSNPSRSRSPRTSTR